MLFCVGECSVEQFGTDSVNRFDFRKIKHFVQFHGNSTLQVFRIFENAWVTLICAGDDASKFTMKCIKHNISNNLSLSNLNVSLTFHPSVANYIMVRSTLIMKTFANLNSHSFFINCIYIRNK